MALRPRPCYNKGRGTETLPFAFSARLHSVGAPPNSCDPQNVLVGGASAALFLFNANYEGSCVLVPLITSHKIIIVVAQMQVIPFTPYGDHWVT